MKAQTCIECGGHGHHFTNCPEDVPDDTETAPYDHRAIAASLRGIADAWETYNQALGFVDDADRHQNCQRVAHLRTAAAIIDTELERLRDALSACGEESDLRNVRGIVQRALRSTDL